MASAARQGTCISSATFAHMSGLNLIVKVSVFLLLANCVLFNQPFVEPCELVLSLFVPLAPPFQVILVMKSATDGAASRQPLRNVLPFHAAASQLDD